VHGSALGSERYLLAFHGEGALKHPLLPFLQVAHEAEPCATVCLLKHPFIVSRFVRL